MIAPVVPASIDADEVARFSAVADDWWNPYGPMRGLHLLQPLRLVFLREQALAHFGRDGGVRRPFEGLTLLDVGCGAGLLTEPMTRLGFAVTGLDASAETIAAAAAHAQTQSLAIDYRVGAAETLAAERGASYDLVLALEVVEHVTEPGAFLRTCARLLAPGGLMVIATINRTLKSFLLAKVIAEYGLGWAPRGAHDWRRFISPEEVRAFLSGEPVRLEGPFGVEFDPMSGCWRRTSDAGVNYLMTATRPAK